MGARLTIETDNVEVDEAFARFHPDAAAGRYVRSDGARYGHRHG